MTRKYYVYYSSEHHTSWADAVAEVDALGEWEIAVQVLPGEEATSTGGYEVVVDGAHWLWCATLPEAREVAEDLDDAEIYATARVTARVVVDGEEPAWARSEPERTWTEHWPMTNTWVQLPGGGRDD